MIGKLDFIGIPSQDEREIPWKPDMPMRVSSTPISGRGTGINRAVVVMRGGGYGTHPARPRTWTTGPAGDLWRARGS